MSDYNNDYIYSDMFFPNNRPAKKFGGKKIIALFLGMMLMVGGLASGVVLVLYPQLFNQKAQTVNYGPICDPTWTCYNGYLGGIVECYKSATSPIKSYCCPDGKVNVGGICGRPLPTCAPNLVCPDITLYGTTVCNDMSSGVAVKRRCCPPNSRVINNMCKTIPTCDPTADCLSVKWVTGTQECITSKTPQTILYCCPKGYKNILGKCVIPPAPLCGDLKYRACEHRRGIVGAIACSDTVGQAPEDYNYCCPPGNIISNNTCIPEITQLCKSDQCPPVNIQIVGSTPCYKSSTSTAISYCCVSGYTAQKISEYAPYECVPPDKIICSASNPCTKTGYKCNLATGTCSPKIGVGNCADNYGTCYVKTAIGTSQTTGELCDAGGHWATCAEGYVCSNYDCKLKN